MDSAGAARERIDLTNDAGLVRLLLDDTRLWRQRLVETLVFGAFDVVAVRSQYQVEIPSGLLVQHGLMERPVSSIRAILPLSTRPKASLLGFSLEGPDGAPARVLTRRNIAAFQSEYLLEMWETGPVETAAPDEGLIEAIMGFHAGRFRLTVAQEVLPEEGLARYLTENLGFDVPIQWVKSRTERLEHVSAALTTALAEPADPWSAAENPLFALANRVPRPVDLEEASALIDDYGAKVEMARQLGDEEFLETLGEYGRRWEVLVETELPLDQPVVLTLSEDRGAEYRRGTTSVHLAMGDASSYHLEARVANHAIEFGRVTYRAPNGSQIATTELEDHRTTPQSVVMYSSLPTRTYYATFEARIRLAQDHRLGSWLVLILTVLALVAATLGRYGEETAEAMALLTVPTTFAATIVLTRTEAPLEARLSIGFRRALAGLVFLLWAVAVTQLAAPRNDDDATSRQANAETSQALEVEFEKEG